SLTSGKGNTIDMVKYLIEGNAALGVSGLKARGYTFLRLDEVPDIAAALGSPPTGGGGTGGGGGGADGGRGGGGRGGGTTACGSFDPSWQQTRFANEWWVEFTISGNPTSARLDVVGGESVPLASQFDKWVGATNSRIPTGTQAILHATNAASQSAETVAFR